MLLNYYSRFNGIYACIFFQPPPPPPPSELYMLLSATFDCSRIKNKINKTYNFNDPLSMFPCLCILPYFGKRKQVTKVTFHVQEQNVSVISTDINGISGCLT